MHVLNGPAKGGHKETTHQRVASVEDLVAGRTSRWFDLQKMLAFTMKSSMLNYQQLLASKIAIYII